MKNSKMTSVLVAFGGVLIGLFIGSLILVLVDGNFFTLFASIADGTFGSMYNFGEFIMASSILMLTGISVAFSYKAGIFNIGAEGQFIVGSFVATYLGVTLNLPPVIHPLVAIIGGTIAGIIFGFIPGILKAYFEVSEVVVAIMLNWIALKYTNYLITEYFHGTNSVQSPPIKETASLQAPKLSEFFGGAQIHWGFLFVIIAVVMFWFILEKTKLGYEIKAVGYNKHAARYAGIKEKRMTVVTLMISGGFAGLAGAIYSLGAVSVFNAPSTFLNYGFDGITVAFLGQMAPIGIVASSLLLGALRSAGRVMTETPKEIIDIVIGIILIFGALTPKITMAINKKRNNKEN